MTLDCAIGFVFQIILFFPVSVPVTVYDLMNGEQICYVDERQKENGKFSTENMEETKHETSSVQTYIRLPKRIG